MAAPVGAQVQIYMDTQRTIRPGDEVVTRTGRRYLVDLVRVQQRGANVGRQHLICTVLARDAIHDDPDAEVHTLWWYSRG